MSNLKTAIEKYGEIEAENYEQSDGYLHGFKEALELLFPAIEALKKIEMHSTIKDIYHGGHLMDCNFEAKEALTKLRKTVERK